MKFGNGITHACFTATLQNQLIFSGAGVTVAPRIAPTPRAGPRPVLRTRGLVVSRARPGRSGMLWAGLKPVGDHQKGQLGLLLPILARYHPETLY